MKKKEQMEPVDTSNDVQMVAEGLRCPVLVKVDVRNYHKSNEEIKAYKKITKEFKKRNHNYKPNTTWKGNLPLPIYVQDLFNDATI